MKTILTSLAVAGVILLSAGCKKSAEPDGPGNLGGTENLTITIVNQSGTHPDSSIYFSIMGLDANNNVCWLDTNSNMVPVDTSDNTNGGYCNYFYRLSEVTTMTLKKQMTGARIRFSIGEPLKMKIQSQNPNAGYTDADVNNPGDPNRSIVYDKIEFSYTGSLFINTTLVDYFGIPLELSAWINGKTVRVGMNASRDEIFARFKNQAPAAFKILMQDTFRIVAPQKLLAFSQHYWDSYTDSVWTKYATDSLVITGTIPAPWRAVGRVSGGIMTFRFTSDQFKGETVTITKPTSNNIFGCDGVGALKTDANDPVSKQVLIPKVAGAFNRSVIYGFDDTRGCDTSTFYKHGTTNWFSMIFHKSAIDNRCYGFPYDDDCDQSTLFPSTAVKELTVTITKFK